MDQQAPPGASQYSFVVVANRLPVDATTNHDGTTTWRRSPGGLVSALEPVLRERPQDSAVWVGWSGRASDDTGTSASTLDSFIAEDADNASEASQVTSGMCALAEVPLSSTEVELYYEGFSNASIWPLYHDAIVPPVYHRHMWNAYRKVNERFAQAAADVAAPGATVWIHDYQLQLVPKMLRELRPDVRIGFFLHIPFPPVELFIQLPWRRALIEGLLGADLIGTQVPRNSNNITAVAAALTGAAVDGHDILVHDSHDGPLPRFAQDLAHTRRVRVQDFPISIDSAEVDTIARQPAVQERAREIRAELGDPKWLMLGVDRLDYTKGINMRLKAYYELLDEGSLNPADIVFLQIATPSRGGVEEYQRIRDEIERAVGRIVGRFGGVGVNPMHYLHQSLPREELIAFYVAADLALVTPLRDGMNLVSKEYVVSKTDDAGALVLSEFAGAAYELNRAYLVNPHDADGMKHTIMTALTDDPAERSRRMRAMRAHVLAYDVEGWAQDFLRSLKKHTASRTD